MYTRSTNQSASLLSNPRRNMAEAWLAERSGRKRARGTLADCGHVTRGLAGADCERCCNINYQLARVTSPANLSSCQCL
ncbi:hypothetical protein ElyMa_000280200 [Elysia marginata]|uniref:Uncharacterized protein n=1 Tax=Elysia marginata TaxID=1093978 RepID=A0AAV4F5K6_9GAST|nr:hypothetical protein ElyMa_000280200 [Elysia marginata]